MVLLWLAAPDWSLLCCLTGSTEPDAGAAGNAALIVDVIESHKCHVLSSAAVCETQYYSDVRQIFPNHFSRQLKERRDITIDRQHTHKSCVKDPQNMQRLQLEGR